MTTSMYKQKFLENMKAQTKYNVKNNWRTLEKLVNLLESHPTIGSSKKNLIMSQKHEEHHFDHLIGEDNE